MARSAASVVDICYDGVAHGLVERLGPAAHPDTLVTLRCEELAACVEVARTTDAVYLGVVAAARTWFESGALVEVPVVPGYEGVARFVLVTLDGRGVPPLFGAVRAFVKEHMAKVRMAGAYARFRRSSAAF